MRQNINTKVTLEKFEILVGYADEDDVTVSHIVRQAINEYIERRENKNK